MRESNLVSRTDKRLREFPGSPVVRTPCFHCRGTGSALVTELRSCGVISHILPHFFLGYFCCLVTKVCLTFCDPMDCSLPGSSVHGIFQARILEQVVISFSRGSLILGIWYCPLEKGKATHSSILAWRIPWTVVHGVAESLTHSLTHSLTGR